MSPWYLLLLARERQSTLLAEAERGRLARSATHRDRARDRTGDRPERPLVSAVGRPLVRAASRFLAAIARGTLGAARALDQLAAEPCMPAAGGQRAAR